MSNKDVPSNEDIVNELTKDFESQIIDEELNKDNSEPFVISPGSRYEDIDTEPATEEKQQVFPDDYVDEEQLKQVQEKWSADEKENNKIRALDLKKRGNTEFKDGEYIESIRTYTEALQICPLENVTERSVLYSNRAASKMQVKRKETAIEDCSKAIELNTEYVRAYLRRARLYEECEKFDESLADYKRILELDPGNPDALAASVRLPPIINERNEKMKEEMLGKLKDLGNVILRPFGLSTDNFKMTQDPNTGGYSVNFQQNRNG